jgi:hypothetical protein
MPQDALEAPQHSLASAEEVAVVSDQLSGEGERLSNRLLADASATVAAAQGMADTFRRLWRQIVLEVAHGRTAVIHASRARFAGALERRLELLKLTRALVVSFRDVGRTDISDPSVLAAEIAELERLKTTVIDHWKTGEDLEDLAARDYPLSTADLEHIGPLRQPPAAFYAEESKPF